jgi:hypothetical protein
MYIPTDVSITGPQLKTLILKGTCQIGKDGLKDCNSRVLLHPMMAARVEKARKTGKGVRLMCNLPEIRQTGVKGLKGSGMSGTGWFSDAVDWIKDKAPKAYSYIKDTVVPWVRDNIINTETYQQSIRPKIREKLEGFAENAPYANLTVPALEWAGDQTKAFGVKKPRAASQSKRHVGAKGCETASCKATKGGSFLTS